MLWGFLKSFGDLKENRKTGATQSFSSVHFAPRRRVYGTIAAEL